jgi:hypothetical protein
MQEIYGKRSGCVFSSVEIPSVERSGTRQNPQEPPTAKDQPTAATIQEQIEGGANYSDAAYSAARKGD